MVRCPQASYPASTQAPAGEKGAPDRGSRPGAGGYSTMSPSMTMLRCKSFICDLMLSTSSNVFMSALTSDTKPLTKPPEPLATLVVLCAAYATVFAKIPIVSSFGLLVIIDTVPCQYRRGQSPQG